MHHDLWSTIPALVVAIASMFVIGQIFGNFFHITAKAFSGGNIDKEKSTGVLFLRIILAGLIFTGIVIQPHMLAFWLGVCVPVITWGVASGVTGRSLSPLDLLRVLFTKRK